jgi:hypothetical protein
MHSRLASSPPRQGCSISLITDGASRFQNWTTVAPARIRDAIRSSSSRRDLARASGVCFAGQKELSLEKSENSLAFEANAQHLQGPA